MILQNEFNVKNLIQSSLISPITQSRFKSMQETGMEAELFFMKTYQKIDIFSTGHLEDARLYGDGYDFQITTSDNTYVVEVKGIRQKQGKIRLTEKEYLKAEAYKNDYILAVILNLCDIPKVKIIENPIKNLSFKEKIIKSKLTKEYHLETNILIWLAKSADKFSKF